jgi:hypothetical protein
MSVLAPTVKISVEASALGSGTRVGFHVPHATVADGATPFLIMENPEVGSWKAVPSQFDSSLELVSATWAPSASSAASGTATSQHQSPQGVKVLAATWVSAIWTVVAWGSSAVTAALKGVLAQVFSQSPLGAAAPSCGQPARGAEVVTVTDDHPGGGIAACAQAAGSGLVLAKVVNQRSYPVDLRYPAGATVNVDMTDPFTELGGILNRVASGWANTALIPSGGEADATVPLTSPHSAQMLTQMDTEAYLVGILGSGLQVMADMGGVFGWSSSSILTALGGASCLRGLVRSAEAITTLSASTAEQLASVGFQCLTTAASSSAIAVAAGLLSLVASLATSLVGGIWIVIDTITNNDVHTLTLAAGSASLTVPTACSVAGAVAVSAAPATSPDEPEPVCVQPNSNGYAWLVADDNRVLEQVTGVGGNTPTFNSPMTMQGTAYSRGLAVDAEYDDYSTLGAGNSETVIYNLGGAFISFSALVGLDDSFNSQPMEAEFIGDGRVLASASFTPGEVASPVSFPVQGVQTLSVEVGNLTGLPYGSGYRPGQLDVVNPVVTANPSDTSPSTSTDTGPAQFRDLNWISESGPTNEPLGDSLDTVSCPSDTLCVAADSDGGVLTSTRPTGGEPAWTESIVSAGSLDSVSCPSTTFCVAVGSGADNAENVFTSTNPAGGAGAWSTAINVDGGGEGWQNIACPSANLCVAMNSNGQTATSTNPAGGTATWTVLPPVGTFSAKELSCPTATLCVAAGSSEGAGNLLISTNPAGGASAWKLLNLDGGASFSSVACFAANLCIASEADDGSGDVFTSTDPSGGAEAWTPTSMSGDAQSSVRCPSGTLCILAAYTQTLALIDTADGTANWTIEAVVPGTETMDSVSCTADLCVGVTQRGYVDTGT